MYQNRWILLASPSCHKILQIAYFNLGGHIKSCFLVKQATIYSGYSLIGNNETNLAFVGLIVYPHNSN